jgi:amino acid transporter
VTGLPVPPFMPSAEFRGCSAVGYCSVFTVLSFAGFEGAATLGEEVVNPRRSIPIATAGTVILAGTLALVLLYVGVTGAQLAESLNAGQITWALSGLAGILALTWPLYNSVYPIPDFRRDLWPGVVIAWILAGGSLLIVRPTLRIAGPE